jgi:hypothetical protein
MLFHAEIGDLGPMKSCPSFSSIANFRGIRGWNSGLKVNIQTWRPSIYDHPYLCLKSQCPVKGMASTLEFRCFMAVQ